MTGRGEHIFLTADNSIVSKSDPPPKTSVGTVYREAAWAEAQPNKEKASFLPSTLLAARGEGKGDVAKNGPTKITEKDNCAVRKAYRR